MRQGSGRWCAANQASRASRSCGRCAAGGRWRGGAARGAASRPGSIAGAAPGRAAGCLGEVFFIPGMAGSVYPGPGIVIRPGLAYISKTARAGPNIPNF